MASLEELRVIADDTTGALDVASSLGGSTPKRVHFGHQPKVPAGSYIIDANSRYLEHGEYTQVLARYMETLRECPPNFFKIDSTLRGNAPTTIQWLEQNTSRPIVCVPMFPQQHRTCIGGIYRVDGTLLTETEYAHDHHFQLDTPDIRHISPNTLHTSIEMVRDGRLARRRRSNRVFTFDAETDQDMMSINTIVSRHIEDPIYVGSAAWAQTITGTEPCVPSITRTQNPVFFVGSQSEHSRSQVEHMIQNTPCRRGGIVINGSHFGLVYQTPSAPLDRAQIDQSIRMTAEAILSVHDPELLFVTGGSTALEFFHSFGATDMTVHGRLFGGVAQGVDDAGRTYLTKPGGFGGVDTLTHLYNYVTS